jgi:hypothetical protein
MKNGVALCLFPYHKFSFSVNKFRGFNVQGSAFRVQRSGFSIQGSTFRVQRSGYYGPSLSHLEIGFRRIVKMEIKYFYINISDPRSQNAEPLNPEPKT